VTRRRFFASTLAGVGLLITAGWPGTGRAQTRISRVGVLMIDGSPQWLEPFQRALYDQGWIEGQNLTTEIRTARDDQGFANAAAEFTRLRVDAIFAVGPPAVRATRGAAQAIPLVAIDLETDPKAAGYIETYSRPGGYVTGVFLDMPELAGKWIELLKSLVPGLVRVAVLWDPASGSAHLEAIRAVAPAFGVQLRTLEVRTPADIDKAFASLRARSQAFVILPSPMMYVQSAQVAKLARKHRLPGISMLRPFSEAGGTLAYGPDMPSMEQRCAVIVGKILGGAKPGDIPVERPTNFELIVNLKAAHALGLEVPQAILLSANQVIK